MEMERQSPHEMAVIAQELTEQPVGLVGVLRDILWAFFFFFFLLFFLFFALATVN